MSDYIRPGILAKALGVTTDCLKKRRSRGSEIFDYIVKPSGHVLYNWHLKLLFLYKIFRP